MQSYDGLEMRPLSFGKKEFFFLYSVLMYNVKSIDDDENLIFKQMYFRLKLVEILFMLKPVPIDFLYNTSPDTA